MSDAKPAYSPGLAGVIAGETAVSCIDQDAGLLYRGYDIHDLASKATFEELVFLLLQGERPTAAQAEEVRAKLAAESQIPAAVVSVLKLQPKEAHPIDVLRTGVSMLASFDPDLNDQSHDANMRKSMRLIAKLSTVVTSAYQVSQGREPKSPPAHLSFAARFMFGITGKEPEQWLIDAMNLMLALYLEHEYNASTFAARVTASTLSDLYAAAVTALGTLKGPLHGGANEEAMKMLRDVGSADRAESWLLDKLAKKEKIMGFGHRVYKHGDSRVPATRQLTRELGKRFGHEDWVTICERLEAVMEREKGLYANLDLYAAPALYLMGIPSDLNISMFAASRVVGWCAHVIEQHDHNRLIRPRCIYTGPARRKYS